MVAALMITENEVQKMKAIYNEVDINGAGEMDFDEVCTGGQSIASSMPRHGTVTSSRRPAPSGDGCIAGIFMA